MSAENDEDVAMDDAVAAPIATAVSDAQSAGAPLHPREQDATSSQGSSDSEDESCSERQWVEALTGDPSIAECTLDETAHAAAHQMGARVSVRVPTVSRLVRLDSSYIVDDEPTGAMFVQMLTDAELWPIPELGSDEPEGEGLFHPLVPPSNPALGIAPDTSEPSSGERFLTRMWAYPLLKGTPLQKRMAQAGAADIASLVEPFVANVPPNEQQCRYKTRGKFCEKTNCGLRHISTAGALPEKITERLLEFFGESDRAALAGEIAARAEAGATPAEILRHVTLESGPSRLDSLIAASTRRSWAKTPYEAAHALRELARELTEFIRLPGTTSWAADALVQRHVGSLAKRHGLDRALWRAIKQMTLNDEGRLDERSDGALALLRIETERDPYDMAIWHVFLDLSLLRIPLSDIEQRRALFEEPLRNDRRFTPLLWWKRLAVEQRSTPQEQMAFLRRMLPKLVVSARSLGKMHVGNVLYARQRVLGAIGGPGAAIRYIRALFCAVSLADVRSLLARDPVAVGLDPGEEICGAPFKCGVLLRMLDPRFAVLLATAMAHWMTYGAPLPVNGLPELGGAFHLEAPLVLLQPVEYPRMLRCVSVFQSIVESFGQDVPQQWLDSGAYLAVALNMVRCGWVHQSLEPMEFTFQCLRNALDKGAAYFDLLQGDGSVSSSYDALEIRARRNGPPPFDGTETCGMRVWHMLRTILRHSASRRVSQVPGAAAEWKRTLSLLAAVLERLEGTLKLWKGARVSAAECAVICLLETLFKRASVPGCVQPVPLGMPPMTVRERQPATVVILAHMAMELAATARQPPRAPAGALLVLGRMLQYSVSLRGFYVQGSSYWLFESGLFTHQDSTWSNFASMDNFPKFPELYHIIARRYFEFGMPFSISCTSQEQPTAPCGGYADCRPPAPCDLCENALALTHEHRELLLSRPGDAPVELVAEACERVLFQLMSHGGVSVGSVEAG